MPKIISPHDVKPAGKKRQKKKMPSFLEPWVCPGCKGGKRIGVKGEFGNLEGDCLTCKGTGWIFDPVLMLGVAIDIMAQMGKILHFLQEHLENKELKREIGKVLVQGGEHAQATRFYFEKFVALPENVEQKADEPGQKGRG